MKTEEKMQLLQGMFNGAQLTNVQVIGVVENGAKVVYQEVHGEKGAGEESLSRESLSQAVAAVQKYMWGASAYAVLFCELRDHRGYPNNMSQFERDMISIAQERHLDWICKAGTLISAFRNNPYMKMRVERWEDIGVKSRSMQLLQKFQEELP